MSFALTAIKHILVIFPGHSALSLGAGHTSESGGRRVIMARPKQQGVSGTVSAAMEHAPTAEARADAGSPAGNAGTTPPEPARKRQRLSQGAGASAACSAEPPLRPCAGSGAEPLLQLGAGPSAEPGAELGAEPLLQPPASPLPGPAATAGDGAEAQMASAAVIQLVTEAKVAEEVRGHPPAEPTHLPASVHSDGGRCAARLELPVFPATAVEAGLGTGSSQGGAGVPQVPLVARPSLQKLLRTAATLATPLVVVSTGVKPLAAVTRWLKQWDGRLQELEEQGLELGEGGFQRGQLEAAVIRKDAKECLELLQIIHLLQNIDLPPDN